MNRLRLQTKEKQQVRELGDPGGPEGLLTDCHERICRHEHLLPLRRD